MLESTHEIAAPGVFPPVPEPAESQTVIDAPETKISLPDTKSSAVPAIETSALWLRRSDQLIVGLLVTALVILLGIQWLRLSNFGSVPVELSSQMPREYYYSLDINSASWVEWAQLDGIGQKLARRIVEDREEHGPFRNPADVGRVRGIGPKVLEKLMPFLHGGTDQPQGPST